MEKKAAIEDNAVSVRINRYAYGLYLLLVIYQLAIGELEWAITNFGIAMVFDPFDARVSWQNRKLYQKVWLIIHVSLFLVGLLWSILR